MRFGLSIAAGAPAAENLDAIQPKEVAEYRLLASLLAPKRPGGSELRSNLFASAHAGEGTTTVLLGTALALQSCYGMRVLVVEMNFLRPTLMEEFRLPVGRTLIEVSTGECKVSQAIHCVGNALSVLPAGSGADRAACRDVPGVMQMVLDVARQDFDVVLVDTPPLLERADALALGSVVPNIVLVIEAARTGRRDLALLRERITANGLRIVNAVLNKEKPLLPRWLGG